MLVNQVAGSNGSILASTPIGLLVPLDQLISLLVQTLAFTAGRTGAVCLRLLDHRQGDSVLGSKRDRRGSQHRPGDCDWLYPYWHRADCFGCSSRLGATRDIPTPLGLEAAASILGTAAAWPVLWRSGRDAEAISPTAT